MTSAMKPGRPILVIGLLFFCGGLIWVIIGKHLAIGLGNLSIGLVFIAISASVMRKSATATPAVPRATGSDTSGKT